MYVCIFFYSVCVWRTTVKSLHEERCLVRACVCVCVCLAFLHPPEEAQEFRN